MPIRSARSVLARRRAGASVLRLMRATASPAMERKTFMVRAEPHSVPRARERVVALAEPFVDDERIADLRLVISEVITNAVRHGGNGDVLVGVMAKRGYLCVQVTDTGDGFAPRPRAFEADDDGGFGLFLIERLTRRWGLTREDSKTRVWFEFDFAAERDAAAA
jgi:anti-sigma regulatory factor (Ser/Thr protein kinase)